MPSKVPLTALVEWCRALRHGLDVGLDPVRIFRQQGRSGPGPVRAVSTDVAEKLQDGETLKDALKPLKDRFPPLFTEMIGIGEKAGRLTEVFAELERHFETLLVSRNEFRRMMFWPVLNYVSATLVIALMLFVLGMLPFGAGKMLDPLGVGVGAGGAFVVLLASASLAGAIYLGVRLLTEHGELRSQLEGMVLAVPVIGPCLRAFALQRFCLTVHMTSEAGLNADHMLRYSLRATANNAYTAEADRAVKTVKGGGEISEVLENCGPRLFPEESVQAVKLGEETGRLAEIMRKQAEYYRDEATRRLRVVTRVFGGMVYAAVAIMMIATIYRIANKSYIEPTNQMLDALDDPNKFLRGGNGW